ncbi:MAG: hypothetical protein ACTS22_09800 [Phycisphaerales bacterium]
MSGQGSNARRDEFDAFDEDSFDQLDHAGGFDADSIEDRLEELLSLGDEPGPAAPHTPRRSIAARQDDAPKLADSERRGGKGPDRRKNVLDTRASGLERRRGPGRRLSDFVKAAEEGEMNAEQFLFLQAIETFKKVNNKMYPNWTDVLEVIRLLGYRKVQHSELNLGGAQDWTERPDTESGVRDRRGVSHRRRPAG